MKNASYLIKIFLVGFIYKINAFATPLSFQNSTSFSIENIQKVMNWFTAEPHPMGSKRQHKIASELKQTLIHFGWETKEYNFKSFAPNYEAVQFGGETKDNRNVIEVNGINVIAHKKGYSNCSVIIGGHYDTKYFKNFKFVGANDGGSSTALFLEFARVANKYNFKKNSLGTCDIILAFFDGEEAFLKDWSQGERQLAIQDNLYGSREFVKRITMNSNVPFYDEKPLKLVLIFDMIGHKNQMLSISQGSNIQFANEFLKSAKKIKINKLNNFIEDDHTPFFKFNVPILHIIDWSNLNEWHTANDTLEIISYQAIAQLGESLIQFLKLTRI